MTGARRGESNHAPARHAVRKNEAFWFAGEARRQWAMTSTRFARCFGRRDSAISVRQRGVELRRREHSFGNQIRLSRTRIGCGAQAMTTT
jgi:hypothetical protein